LIQANKKHNYVNLLQAIESTYTQSVQSPNPENAKAFAGARKNLEATILELPEGSLSPSRVKLLEAIGGTFYYARGLLLRIEDIISTSATPSDTLAAIKDLRTKMTEFYKTVEFLENILTKLGVGVEDIPQDSAEIEVLIPDSIIDRHLNAFIKETNYLDIAFSDITEVVTGKRTPLEIRTLGSGSTELYLIVDLATGAQLLAFVTSIILLIHSILQTRRDRDSLKKQEAPDKIIKELKSWEDGRIKEHIDKLRDEILGNYKGEEPRKNELRNALSISLRRLVNRIDRGMDIGVTTAATVEQNEGDLSAADSKQLKDKQSHIAYILKASDTVSQLQRGPEPVLQLSVPEDDSESS